MSLIIVKTAVLSGVCIALMCIFASIVIVVGICTVGIWKLHICFASLKWCIAFSCYRMQAVVMGCICQP